MIDFHCHLDLYPGALQLLSEVEQRNRFTLAVTTSPRAFLATSRVFAGRRGIHVGLGLHPEVATAKVAELDQLVALVRQAPLVGEIGLDGSSRFRSSLPTQRRIFEAGLDECQAQGGRIISIHSRGAEAEVIAALAHRPGAGTPVLHWFSGSQSELQTALKLGAALLIERCSAGLAPPEATQDQLAAACLRMCLADRSSSLAHALWKSFGSSTALFWALYTSIWPALTKPMDEACGQLFSGHTATLGELMPQWQFVEEG